MLQEGSYFGVWIEAVGYNNILATKAKNNVEDLRGFGPGGKPVMKQEKRRAARPPDILIMDGNWKKLSDVEQYKSLCKQQKAWEEYQKEEAEAKHVKEDDDNVITWEAAGELGSNYECDREILKAFRMGVVFVLTTTGVEETQAQLTSRLTIWAYMVATVKGTKFSGVPDTCPHHGDVSWLFERLKALSSQISCIELATNLINFWKKQRRGTDLTTSWHLICKESTTLERNSFKLGVPLSLPRSLTRSLVIAQVLSTCEVSHQVMLQRVILELEEENVLFTAEELITKVEKYYHQAHTLRGLHVGGRKGTPMAQIGYTEEYDGGEQSQRCFWLHHRSAARAPRVLEIHQEPRRRSGMLMGECLQIHPQRAEEMPQV